MADERLNPNWGNDLKAATNAAGEVVGVLKPQSDSLRAPVVVATTDAVTGEITSLTSPSGYQVASDFSRRVGFTVEQASVCVFDQLATGEYVCTDGVSANGNSARRLFLFSGNPVNLAGGTITALSNTNSALTNTVLKATTGAAVGANWVGTAHFSTNHMIVDTTTSGTITVGHTVMATGVLSGALINTDNGGGDYTLSSSPGTLSTRAVSTLNNSSNIYDAWVTSNGDIYFTVLDGNLRSYLFRAKATTYTVGADASYSDNKACIDIGLYGGTHSIDIRTLGKRNFLEATVAGAKHYFFCEYNVSSSRTPGSTNDQVIVYRSTNLGDTWSVFLEFNTGGAVHFIDHFHGTRQDPYTGWIYFMTGDQTTECAILAYNGTAAAPAANTALATIGAATGWKVISGSELQRLTDICFAPGSIYSIPDADVETDDTSSTAFVAVRYPKTLDYVETIEAVTRWPSIWPMLNLQSSMFSAIVSARTQNGGTTAEPYIYVWTSNDITGLAGWTLVLKIKNYYATSGTPRSFFKALDGRIWIGATYGKGIHFTSNVLSGTSVVLTPIPRPPAASLPTIFAGVAG